MIDFKQIIPLHYMECNPKRKRFVRLGSAALAVALAVGSVPFLRGWAAEEEAAVSGSDIVSQSDAAPIGSRGTVTVSRSDAPKFRASSVFNWVKANTVTDFDNAAHGSNSRIGYYSGVTNWLHSSGQTFAEAQGLDYRKCYFLTSWDGSRFIAAYKDQPSSVVTTGYKNASEFETLVNNGVTFFYVPYTETEDISFANAIYEVNVDETITILPTFTPAWSNDLVTWESADPAVASVVYRPYDIEKADGSCQVTGLGAGITTLTATVNGHTVTCQVAVSGESFSGISTISDWSRATKEEDLANAKTISEEYLADWYDEWYDANKNKRFSLGGKTFRGFQIYFVQSYIADPAYPCSEQISYFYNGYSHTQYVAGLNLTNTCVMYIPKSDLSFTYHAAVEPTCTEAGSIAYWTDQDGNKFANANSETPLNDEAITVDALGHNWGAWTETTPATCESDGEETRTCARDASHTETRPIDALGHDWGSWTTKTAATCETAGEETRVCANDPSHTETREVAALSHNWGEWTETTAPSCETAGEETRVCQNDPSHTETRPVNALGHNWEWVTDTEATYEKAGEKHEECSVCHAKQKEHTEIPVKNAPVLEPVSGDHSRYTVGSQDGVTMKIDRMDTDDADIYQHFRNAGRVVKVTGGNGYEKTLEPGDFEASEGSLVIKLTASYLSTLAPGEYKLTATFLIYGTLFESAPVTFTVAASGGTGDSPATDTPATGESIALILLCTILPLFAAFGAVYALRRRRALGE